jgi:hypothetical protein
MGGTVFGLGNLALRMTKIMRSQESFLRVERGHTREKNRTVQRTDGATPYIHKSKKENIVTTKEGTTKSTRRSAITPSSSRTRTPVSQPSAGVAQHEVTIQAPNIQEAIFRIRGTAPYVQNKFSAKAREQMHATQEKGHVAKKGARREAKDFQLMYEQALHKGPDGWYGIPAPAFRNGLISACRLVGFVMTRAKLSLFIKPDGFDEDDMSPLVRIIKGEPKYFESAVRLESGVIDLHARPMWDAGWEADVKINFDADQFALQDVANLLTRVGLQVGVGEGRPDSKKSAGLGWGTFEILSN